ncbi:MAG: hypothetical protein L0Z50_34595 [Verrucomicrobiales bacterium]|nr:hypothetical protein [Verrucomicrobiales bacterium]
MSLVVECKPDEALVIALGLTGRSVEHGANKVGVCEQLAAREGICGMVDEDPRGEQGSYLRRLKEASYSHGIRLLLDEKGNNRVIVLCPRLEEWLVAAAKESGLKMTDFGFSSDHGLQLHNEINHRLGSVARLAKALLEQNSRRLLRLKHLLHETNGTNE